MKEEIEELLRVNGEMGVNAIANGINRPVSSVQKWLERQSYFTKTVNRKWDLAERVMEKVLSDFEGKTYNLTVKEGLIAIERTQIAIDTMKAKLGETAVLLEKLSSLPTIQTSPPPVASQSKMGKKLIELEKMNKILKSHIDRVPSQYRELLRNLDYIELAWQVGAIKMDREINTELTQLIVGEIAELEPSTVVLFEQYQKSDKSVVSNGETAQENSS